MLPRSTNTRKKRDIKSLKLDGRSSEIQRLIGRALRAACDLTRLGERTIYIDCDVLQADGGTRTAAVTGGFVALCLAVQKLLNEGKIADSPVARQVAAVSVGIVKGVPTLDLDYALDSHAEADVNVVMTRQHGEMAYAEVQGTGEGRAFSLQEQQALVELCARGNRELIRKQKELLGDILR